MLLTLLKLAIEIQVLARHAGLIVYGQGGANAHPDQAGHRRRLLQGVAPGAVPSGHHAVAAAVRECLLGLFEVLVMK